MIKYPDRGNPRRKFSFGLTIPEEERLVTVRKDGGRKAWHPEQEAECSSAQPQTQ